MLERLKARFNKPEVPPALDKLSVGDGVFYEDRYEGRIVDGTWAFGEVLKINNLVTTVKITDRYQNFNRIPLNPNHQRNILIIKTGDRRLNRIVINESSSNQNA